MAETFIAEPRNAPKHHRYLVVSAKPRTLRLFRTPSFVIACEVCDAWQRGNFVHDPGETRRLPNPPLEVMTP